MRNSRLRAAVFDPLARQPRQNSSFDCGITMPLLITSYLQVGKLALGWMLKLNRGKDHGYAVYGSNATSILKKNRKWETELGKQGL